MRYLGYPQSLTWIHEANREIDQGEGWIFFAGWVLPDCPGKTGLTGFSNRSDRFGLNGLSWRVVGQENFLHAMAFPVRSLLGPWGGFVVFWSWRSLGISWTKPAWPVCQTGLIDSPACERLKSRESIWPVSETGPIGFGFQQLCLFCLPLRVFRGCWLNLSPRSSSTPVAT
jgi:hypothetical protein